MYIMYCYHYVANKDESKCMNVVDSVNSAPIVKETPSRVVARQGARVELPCVSSAFPLPSYTWSRRGVVLNMTSRVTQVAGNLVLDRTQLDDAGDYVCRTWNQLGSRDVSIRLFVTGRQLCHGRLPRGAAMQLFGDRRNTKLEDTSESVENYNVKWHDVI